MISLCHPIRRYPVAFWQVTWLARIEAARAAQLLRDHYPAVFGRARLRRLGYPGIRQTRTIVGEYMLTVEDVLAGRRFPDAIARVAWPIELLTQRRATIGSHSRTVTFTPSPIAPCSHPS
ncbi:putative membrane protein [Thermomicrobium roseum DSM 5159]|uniref:Putative membrane protein n=1 Tax=Thermomicrobium roseum (strain ATCC 27502 / DSM 5159 / P-2) TaxID=309801 RepID=B9KXY5_THERP|nr:putative membrane protein [Thermomicrobium roseum DSM 5159]